ncbi:MAG: nuclear transport factor 2 family protein [Bacteroidales bacterium]|nr:nuclear transport factor 2 family protein [Bacteroidales bacterium]
MKTKRVLAVMITSLFLLYGCSNSDESMEGLASKASESRGSSEIHREYPKEKREVLATFGAIATNITLGAGEGYGIGSDPYNPNEYMDQLISFHAYDDNFVEFNNGLSYDSEGNEANERTLFGTIVDPGGVQKFAAVPGTLKVAVYYGNVANLTFISDFELLIGGELHIVNNLITLLFVKTDGEWKMNHEHHSPVNVEGSIESETGSNPSVPDLGSVAQQEVLATFGAIAESITLGAGKGYDSEYMDQLISFHAYGRKFTEFNNGESFDSAGNEHNERQLFGEVVSKVQYFGAAPGTLKVAVYNGNVANLTFLSDFILDIKDGPTGHRVNNLITLLFVKTKGEWKMVHEHHSDYMGKIDWEYPI